MRALLDTQSANNQAERLENQSHKFINNSINIKNFCALCFHKQ